MSFEQATNWVGNIAFIGVVVGLMGMAVASIWEAQTAWRACASVAAVCGILFGATLLVVGVAVSTEKAEKASPIKD